MNRRYLALVCGLLLISLVLLVLGTPQSFISSVPQYPKIPDIPPGTPLPPAKPVELDPCYCPSGVREQYGDYFYYNDCPNKSSRDWCAQGTCVIASKYTGCVNVVGNSDYCGCMIECADNAPAFSDSADQNACWNQSLVPGCFHTALYKRNANTPPGTIGYTFENCQKNPLEVLCGCPAAENEDIIEDPCLDDPNSVCDTQNCVVLSPQMNCIQGGSGDYCGCLMTLHLAGGKLISEYEKHVRESDCNRMRGTPLYERTSADDQNAKGYGERSCMLAVPILPEDELPAPPAR